MLDNTLSRAVRGYSALLHVHTSYPLSKVMIQVLFVVTEVLQLKQCWVECADYESFQGTCLPPSLVHTHTPLGTAQD